MAVISRQHPIFVVRLTCNVAFDNYKDIYTSNSPKIAVQEFGVARRTNDE
jgi:hypothetical protein